MRRLIAVTFGVLGLTAFMFGMLATGSEPSSAAGAVAAIDGTPTATPLPTYTPLPTPRTDGSMEVDCDAGAPGVQASCAYPEGESFAVQVHVPQAPGEGYFGLQARLRWDDTVVDYLPTEEPADEALWEECIIAVRSGVGTFQNPEPGVLFGCAPFPRLTHGSTSTGAVLQFQFTCRTEGTSTLKLVEYAEVGVRGSYFVDGTIKTIIPNITNATITCLPDTDSDGCTDSQELGLSALSGGQRDPLNHWDFFDTPGPTGARDRQVSISDIAGVIARFGATGSPDADPLAAPPAEPAYHTAFDRGGQDGPYRWSLAPANGTIAVGDIGAVVAQFGHSCA